MKELKQINDVLYVLYSIHQLIENEESNVIARKNRPSCNQVITLQFQHSSMTIRVLWPNLISYKNVLIVTLLAAPYTSKAIQGQQILYPRRTHVCLPHGLHREAKLVRLVYKSVLAEKRRSSFRFQNRQQHVVIKCNAYDQK